MISLFYSCKEENKHVVDVSGVPVDMTLQRFEVDFYNTTQETLKTTKEKYPMFFPEATPDTVWMGKISNKDEIELYQETIKIYSEATALEEQLISLFKHVIYYNKSFTVPDVFTTISNIDYEYRVIYNPAILIISLDCYLGSDHQFYSDYPNYIKQNNTKEHIVVDVANQIISKQVPYISDRSFLGKMIQEGKKMYLLDRYLPETKDRIKIGYSKVKYDWAVQNEEQVWKYFLDRNLLYSTETKLNKQFLDNAPFSKFYLSQDNLSPGRIGVYVGWQIVRSFMSNNDVTLQELLTKKPEELFLKSKYKPRR